MAGQKEHVEFDADAFEAGLRKAIRSFTVESEDMLVRIGLEVQNDARRYCPVDTGRLRSSIQSSGLQRDGRGPYVEVGSNVEYAPYVEFGTASQQPQPYLRPAFLGVLRSYAAKAQRITGRKG